MKKLHDQPSPGHVLEAPPFLAREPCEGVAVVEGERVWLSCPWAIVRVDPRARSAVSYPFAAPGKLHGFAARSSGAVVLVGDSLLVLGEKGGADDVTTLARDPWFGQALGLHVDGSAIEVAAPHDIVRLAADRHRFGAIAGDQRRSVVWRNDPRAGPMLALSARKREGRNEEWRFLYHANPSSPLYVAGEDPAFPPLLFDTPPTPIPDAEQAYFDSFSGAFPRQLDGKSPNRIALIRVGRAGIADWELGGEGFVRADLLLTPEGLVPLLETSDGLVRHGRTLAMKRDVDTQLHATWAKSSEADPVSLPALAADWPLGRTIVVPLGDGGVAFVSSRGRVALAGRALERTDPIAGPARIWLALKRVEDGQKRIPPLVHLFGWPILALLGVALAFATKRRVLLGAGFASAVWILLIVVSYSPLYVVWFAKSL